MAEELRRLIRLSVSTAPPAEETAALTAQLAAVADRLEAHRPEVPLPRFMGPAEDGPAEWPAHGGHHALRHCRGGFNPLALPVRLAFEPPRALGYATFSVAYEGAPGCVHGGCPRRHLRHRLHRRPTPLPRPPAPPSGSTFATAAPP